MMLSGLLNGRHVDRSVAHRKHTFSDSRDSAGNLQSLNFWDSGNVTFRGLASIEPTDCFLELLHDHWIDSCYTVAFLVPFASIRLPTPRTVKPKRVLSSARRALNMQGTKSQPVDDLLESGLSLFRHAPKTANTEKIRAKEEARSINQGVTSVF